MALSIRDWNISDLSAFPSAFAKSLRIKKGVPNSPWIDCWHCLTRLIQVWYNSLFLWNSVWVSISLEKYLKSVWAVLKNFPFAFSVSSGFINAKSLSLGKLPNNLLSFSKLISRITRQRLGSVYSSFCG